MKKFLGILLVLLMIPVGLGVLAESESAWDFDAYNYSLDGYTGTESELVIPAVIQDCTVDIIGLNAFNGVSGLTSLTLPETVRELEDGAISYCDDLTSLTLNDGLVIISDYSLCGNTALEEVTIPASVSYIGDLAFNDCENLRSITFNGVCPVMDGVCFDYLPEDAVVYVPDDQLEAYTLAFMEMGLFPDLQPSGLAAGTVDYTCDPACFTFDAATGVIAGYEGCDVRVDVPAEINGTAVKAIGSAAFQNMPYLCYVTLPEGVETIGDSAFEGSSRLRHVTFPSTLKIIGDRAFASGLQAKRIQLPEGLEAIGSEAFDFAHRLSGALELPEGLKTIGSRAFANCVNLQEAYIPAAVETIGENAFEYSGIQYVVFGGTQLPEMPETTFANCTLLFDIDLHTTASKQEMLDLQATVDALGLPCRVWRMQNPNVDYIEDGLDVYENGVLTAYTGQQSHIRPWDDFDGCAVTAIGEGVFKDSQTLEYFAVPYSDAFTTIEDEAFAGSSVRVVDLFDSVTTIGAGAFRDCVQLEQLTLPESVTFVGSGALSGCTGLKELIVLCDPAILPDDLLEGCRADLAVYAAPSASADALKRLSRIADRAWNQPVTRLGEALPEAAVMPYEPLPGADFWYDAEYARLDDYTGYELNLFLPREIDGVPLTMLGGSVMNRACCYDDCDAELPVVSVVIPETYTEIVPYAFANCKTLETFVCYAPIELLPDGAFQNCTTLREVIFVNGVHSIGANVFENCSSLQTVYVGPYLETVDNAAFMDAFGEPLWSLDKCIADPAQLPDVAALLDTVKCAPMPTPAPTATPAPAVPVGQEGAPYFGMWIGTEMCMDGYTMNLADFGMTMTLVLLEDGRMILDEEEIPDLSMLDGVEAPGWRVENGIAIGDGCTMTILEDGRLMLDDQGSQLYLVRSGAESEAAPAQPAVIEPTPAPAPPAEPPAPEASSAAYTEIKFICVNADVDGYTLDASMLGGEYSLIFHNNGTADLVVVGAPMPAMPWQQVDNGNVQLDYFGTKMDIVWTESGFDMNYFDTMMMHFVPAN